MTVSLSYANMHFLIAYRVNSKISFQVRKPIRNEREMISDILFL